MQGRILRKSPPLLPIFRSRSIVLLLAYLFNRAGDEPSNISQLARRFNLSTSTVNRDVAELEQAGLLSTEEFGRSKIVRLDEASPYHGELEALFRKAFGPQEVLAELLADVKGVEEAYLYGSYAARYRGEPGPQPADIDLLVVSDGTADTKLVNRVSLEAGRLLGREVNPVVISRAEWDASKTGFLQTLHKRPLLPLALGAP